MNINDVPGLIKQWMQQNGSQTRSHSQINESNNNSVFTLFDGSKKKIQIEKLDSSTNFQNLLNEVSTPISDANSTQIQKALEEIEEKKKHFEKIEEENLKLKEEIEKYRHSFKDMKTNMLQNEQIRKIQQ